MVLDLKQLTELLIPAPPPGIERNIENPPSRRDELFIMGGTCGALICILVIFRAFALATRRIQRYQWWLELNILAAIVFTLAYVVFSIAALTYPALLGVHVWDQNLATAAKRTPLLLRLLLQSLYPVALFWTKFCLLLIYLNLYRFSPGLWRVCLLAIGVTFLCHFATAIATPITCAPLRGRGWLDYYLALDSASCHKAAQVAIFQSMFNIVSDLFLLVLALPAALNMPLPIGKAARVCALLLACLCVLVGSVFGVYFRIYQDMHPFDITWEMISTIMASIGELTAGIMVLCIPALATLWRKDMWQSSSATDTDSLKTKIASQPSSIRHGKAGATVREFDEDSVKYFNKMQSQSKRRAN